MARVSKSFWSYLISLVFFDSTAPSSWSKNSSIMFPSFISRSLNLSFLKSLKLLLSKTVFERGLFFWRSALDDCINDSSLPRSLLASLICFCSLLLPFCLYTDSSKLSFMDSSIWLPDSPTISSSSISSETSSVISSLSLTSSARLSLIPKP